MTDAPASRVRPARRSPSDLSFTVDGASVDRITDGEPAWLGADRRAALARFEALPIESNMLYTTYVDLRTAVLDASSRTRDRPPTTCCRTAPSPTPGRPASPRSARTGSRSLALDAVAADAGVTLETLGEFDRR